MSNASVTKFQRLMNRLPAVVGKAINEQSQKNANAFAAAVKAKAPNVSGTLVSTIRVVAEPAKFRAQVRVGGNATKRSGGIVDSFLQGVTAGLGGRGPYDYVRAAEYGRVGAPGNGFFWPTWRSMSKGFKAATREAAKRALEQEFRRG